MFSPVPCSLFVLVPPSIRQGAHRGIHLEPDVGVRGSNGDEVSLVLLLSCYFVSLSLSFFAALVWFIMCFGVVIWRWSPPPHATVLSHSNLWRDGGWEGQGGMDGGGGGAGGYSH